MCNPAYGLSVLLSLLMHFCYVQSKAVSLTEDIFDKYVNSHELIFINFYADWCRFSQMLGPTFDESAEKIAAEYPQPNKVLFAKVDAVAETNLATRFKITKYPTLKLVRNGKLMKREYRGPRSVDALTEHVRDLLKDPVVELETHEQLQKVDEKKRSLIIYIQDKSIPAYDVFLKVAMDLRDDCAFYIAKGSLATSHLPTGSIAQIVFKPAKTKVGVNDEVYNGALLSYDELSAWSNNRCIPLVREITFENAEELTEEGLPFLILFHHPDDLESPKKFNEEVQKQLLDDRTLMNFVVADGVKFAHPLHHLGKTASDLPLIAIDSFRHMYLFPKFQDLSIPGKLKNFVLDLHSGKLHREFHYGPDPVTNNGEISTNPPESTFKKLAPSPNRYTLLRDEL